MKLEQLPPKRLVPNPDNPRTINEKDPAFIALIESVRKLGVQQPLQVRTHPSRKDKFEILAGHRRHRAALAAKCPEVPVIDYGAMDDEAAFRIAFIENANREDLTPLEQGQAAATALAKCQGNAKAAGVLMGQTPRWVALRAAVHEQLADCWRGEMAPGGLTGWGAGHLAAIARFPANVQEAWHGKLKKGNWPWSHCADWTVEELEKQTADEQKLLGKAPFDTSSESKCVTCTKRTSCQPLLWDAPQTMKSADGGVTVTTTIKPGDRCLDPKCWAKREASAAKRQVAAMRQKYDGLVLLSNASFVNENATKLKRCYGKVLSKGDVTICKKKDKGATPALIVAGRDKGKVRYVKVKKTPTLASQKARKPSAAEQKASAERARWDFVANRFAQHLMDLAYADLPDNKLTIVPLVATFYATDAQFGYDGMADYRQAIEKARKQGPSNVLDVVLKRLWGQATEGLDCAPPSGSEEDRAVIQLIAEMLKLDLQAWCDEAVVSETERAAAGEGKAA